MSRDPLRLRVAVGHAELVWPAARLHAYAAHWGADVARDWLPVAAHHAELLCRRWELVPLAPAGEGVQSLVLHAATADGAPVVLKVPASSAAGHREHAALTGWAPGPVPRVEAYDAATGALLLEQLALTTEGYTARDLAALARRLHVPAAPGTDPVEKTCRMLLRAARHHHAGRHTERRHETDLEVAEELMAALAADGERVLLHGDLLHKNVLTTPAGLHAIDPQPVAGPAELDLARWVAWGGSDHATGFDTLIDELVRAATETGDGWIDADRLVRWTWAVSVCENKPGRAGEQPRVAFLDSHRLDVQTGTSRPPPPRSSA